MIWQDVETNWQTTCRNLYQLQLVAKSPDNE